MLVIYLRQWYYLNGISLQKKGCLVIKKTKNKKRVISRLLLVSGLLLIALAYVGISLSKHKPRTVSQSQPHNQEAITSESQSDTNTLSTSSETSEIKESTETEAESRSIEVITKDTLLDKINVIDGDSNQELVKLIESSMVGLPMRENQPTARYSVFVQDLNNPDILADVANWQPADRQYSASTIKLFILTALYRQFSDMTLTPDDVYTYQEKDTVTGTGTIQYDPIGSTYTLVELARLMIVESDNIATNVLIDKVGGFNAVNQEIHHLVGKNAHSKLERYMMDTSNLKDGRANRANVRELMETFIKLYRNEILGPGFDDQMLALFKETKNKAKLGGNLPKKAIIYNKTGESSLRGIENDIAIIEYKGQVFAVGVMIQLDGNEEKPVESLPEESTKEKEAITLLGKNLTQWFEKH